MSPRGGHGSWMAHWSEGFLPQFNLADGCMHHHQGGTSNNLSPDVFSFPTGPCETNTSPTVSLETTPPTPSSSQLTHPQSTGIAGSNPTALRGLPHTPTALLQAPTTSSPYITSSGKAAVPSSATVTPLRLSTSQTPLVSNIGKADTNAGVAPLLVGGSSGGAVLVVVALLFATLAVALVVRYRTRHPLQNKKSFSTPQTLNGHNLTTSGKVNPRNVVPKPAGDSSDEGNTIFGANTSKPIVVDSNPAYGSTSLDKKPAYSTSSLPEQSMQTTPIEIGSNPAYGSSLQANPAYTSSSQAMEMDFNPSYASPGGQGQKDEIYSYIPNEEEQRVSWTSSVLIPTGLNEAYTSMTSHQEEVAPEGDCTDDEGYVINSLAYEVAPDELKTRGVPHNHSEHEVNQLTRDTENSSHSRMADSMTINEAYIAVNQATD